MDPLPGPAPVVFVIAKGSGSISTGSAYADYDALEGPKETKSSDPLIRELTSGLFPHELLYNRFEELIIPKLPEVGMIKKILRQSGARSVLMSGSGSAVFGCFWQIRLAQQVCTELQREGYFAVLSEPCPEAEF